MSPNQRRANVCDPDPRYDDTCQPAEYRERLEDEVAEMAVALVAKRGTGMVPDERKAFFRELQAFGLRCCELCVERGDARVLYREPEADELKRLAGQMFFRAFAWIAEAKTLVAFGQRARVMIYVMRPAMIGAATLEHLGEEMGVTRQAVHKLKRELEDTFRDSFPTRTDKPQEARDKCRSTPHRRDY